MKKMLILFALAIIFIAGCGQEIVDNDIDFEAELDKLVNETNVLLEQAYVAGGTRVAEECSEILNSLEREELRLLRNTDGTLRLVEVTNEISKVETNEVETK